MDFQQDQWLDLKPVGRALQQNAFALAPKIVWVKSIKVTENDDSKQNPKHPLVHSRQNSVKPIKNARNVDSLELTMII
jgi:hypothetical protein